MNFFFIIKLTNKVIKLRNSLCRCVFADIVSPAGAPDIQSLLWISRNIYIPYIGEIRSPYDKKAPAKTKPAEIILAKMMLVISFDKKAIWWPL